VTAQQDSMFTRNVVVAERAVKALGGGQFHNSHRQSLEKDR